MTVCIAVTPTFTSTIILVSDQLLSSDVASVDGTVLKLGKISPALPWYVMFAGDATKFESLLHLVREELIDVESPRREVVEIAAAFEKACERMLRHTIESEILSPFGIGRDDFVQKGREWFGEARFQEFVDQIARTDLGIELLIAGLDGWARTHLLSVSPRGAIAPSPLPYHAIGSGAFAALGTLYQLSFFPTPDIEETTYRACVAKFSAENVPTVGDATYALVVEPMSDSWTLINDIDEIRHVWKTSGQPSFPPKARRSIARDLRGLRPHRPTRSRRRQ